MQLGCFTGKPPQQLLVRLNVWKGTLGYLHTCSVANTAPTKCDALISFLQITFVWLFFPPVPSTTSSVPLLICNIINFMDSGVILVSFCEFILNVTLFGGVWFCCCKVLRQWTLLRAHGFLFLFFWDIFPSMCERKRKQHKTVAAQAGEMCENEHARNYEWHYGRLGAECYKLKVYKRENYKALLWENCIFSSVTPAVPLQSLLLASIYCLNWELPPCCGYLATCKLNSFEYPSSFFYLPSCCCFFFLFLFLL